MMANLPQKPAVRSHAQQPYPEHALSMMQSSATCQYPQLNIGLPPPCFECDLVDGHDLLLPGEKKENLLCMIE